MALLILVPRPIEAAAVGVASGRQAEPADADTAFLESVLLADPGDPIIRRGAAVRLLQADRPAARAALQRAAGSGSRVVHTALVEAMHEIQRWPAAVLDPLVSALPTWARDETASAESRIASISALGRVRTVDSLRALIEILQSPQNAPPIVDAATTALAALTGQSIGADRVEWIAWWREHADLSPEELFPPSTESLLARLERAEAQQRAAKLELEQVQSRLLAALGELLLQMSPEQRQERIARLLGDPLPSVRSMALVQVERILGSAGVPAESVQSGLIDVLSDPVSSHRAVALKLLESIGRPMLAEQLAPSFANEQEPELLGLYLAIFRRTPTALATDRLIALLSDGHTTGPTPDDRLDDAAARALATLIESGQVDDTAIASVRDLVAPSVRDGLRAGLAVGQPEGSGTHSNGSIGPNGADGLGAGMVRLFGLVADESDLAVLESSLVRDGSAGPPLRPALRRAAADALRYRGRLEPLMAIKDDEVIYPALVRGLSEPPVDIRRVEMLISVVPGVDEPTDGVRGRAWTAAIRAALERLSPGELLQADDLLAATNAWSADLRLEALARMADRPSDEVDPRQRAEIVARAADASISNGDLLDAIRLLDLVPIEGHPNLLELRFRALALAGQYREAAGLQLPPERWIALLEWASANMPAAAPPLLDEIVRLFKGDLAETNNGSADPSSTRAPRLSSDESRRLDTVARHLQMGTDRLRDDDPSMTRERDSAARDSDGEDGSSPGNAGT